MLQKIRGIVLHSLKYSDDSNIVDIFTEPYGRLSYLVRVSRTKKRTASNALFMPLSLVEFEADYKPTRSLYHLRDAKQLYVFSSLPYDACKSSIALFLSEFLYRALRQEGENLPLYTYLYSSVQWLDVCDRNYANFHLVFLMRLSRFLGFFPNLEGYRPGYSFDMANACFVPPAFGRSGLSLSPEESAQLRQLMRMNFDTMHLFTLTRAQRTRCLEVIIQYYRVHLPDFPEIKLLAVLKELFD